MDTHIRGVLERFARHTKHKEAQLECADDISLLLKKYVALHVGDPRVPPSAFYPYVSDDYNMLSLRTHAPPLNTYATTLCMDSDLTVFIMKNGSVPPEARDMDSTYMATESLFQGFRDVVFPTPVGQEQWATATRPNQWKERGYFFSLLSSRDKTNFRDLVRAIHDADIAESERVGEAHKQDLERIYTALKGYGDIVPRRDDAVAVAAEIGTMISRFKFSPESLGTLFDDLETESPSPSSPLGGNKPDEDVVVGGGDTFPKIVTLKMPADRKEWKDADFRTLPVITQYKGNVGLSKMFSTRKAVKQMLLSQILTGETADLKPEAYDMTRILGSQQTKLPGPKSYSASEWATLMSALDGMHNATESVVILRSPHSVELATLLPGPVDFPQLLNAALTLCGSKEHWKVDGVTDRALASFMRRNPHLSREIVEATLFM
jgi:hypothetical protein